LGAKKNSILQAALLNSLQVAILGSLMGVLLGLGLESYLAYLAKTRFDVELGTVSWLPAFGWGFLLSFLCVGVSVLLPLREILRVPVSQAIRQDESQGTLLNYKDALIGLGVAILIIFLVGPAWKMSLTILVGVSLAVILLFVTGNVLLRAFSRFQFSFAARHASLQLERKKGRTQLLIVTFGLSLFFLFLILFLGKSIRSQIDQINNSDFPNVFAINLGPESKEKLASIIPQAMFTSTAQARVVEIKGKEIVEGVVPEEGEDRFYLTREYVVTKRSELSKGEELLAGKTLFGPSSPGIYQVSLEESFAKQFQLKVGDELKIDLAGVRLSAVMSSVRKVNWFNFQPNFFIVFHPSEIEGAPMNFVATARVPKEKITFYQAEVAKNIPQATLVDGDALASRLLKIINQLSTAVYAVTLFSLLSCFFVFVGIFLARRVELLREVSLWRCLGLRNGRILSIYV
jgi:putative ABC transport system permease protein